MQGLTHTFGDKTVFKGVDFRVNHGDHVGLIGANGVGKSTLMQILSGQLVPDAGEVAWLSGTQVGHLSQHLDLVPGRALRDQLRSAFAHLYTLEAEGQALADAMAGCEPEELDAKLRRFSVIQEQLTAEGFYDIDVKVDRVAAGLGLTELGLDTPVDSLSGGQRTKVLLAQLLLQQPQVLLLDEPTNYLDTAHVKWLTEYLSGYPHAFVVVSHDVDFLNQIVTVVLHLEHQTLTRYPGNIQAFEAAYELRKRQAFDAFARQQETISR
ncbi:MAG TPA: ATP-binding cassette domain-containing protein, partial [Candidatus Angelobacter sp.]|nr:ATP-binding cassette domain-containing protein [Candidatus Angelobacter sp.]